MSASIVSTINGCLSPGYEIVTEYDQVTAKGGTNKFIYVIGGPSTRAIRRIELEKISKSINVPGYRFFYINSDKSFRYKYRYRQITMSSEIGFVIGISDQDFDKIKANSLDEETLWTKGSPTYILTLKPKSSAEKSFQIRPASIPGLVENKLTPEKLRELTVKYVNSVEPDLVPLFDSYFDDLKKTTVSQHVSMIDFGSESLEIFSAYSLAHELTRKTQLRKKLGIETNKKDGWYILFPRQQNLPLVDYYLYFPGARDDLTNKSISKKCF